MLPQITGLVNESCVRVKECNTTSGSQRLKAKVVRLKAPNNKPEPVEDQSSTCFDAEAFSTEAGARAINQNVWNWKT